MFIKVAEIDLVASCALCFSHIDYIQLLISLKMRERYATYVSIVRFVLMEFKRIANFHWSVIYE